MKKHHELSSTGQSNGSGPGTIAGKRQSRKNALRHGLCAKELFLPSEEPEVFEALHRDLREDRRPDGVLEDYLVLQLAMLMWRKQRLLKAEAAEIAKITEFVESDWLRQQALSARKPNSTDGLLGDFSNSAASERAIQLLTNLRNDFERRGFNKGEDVSILREIYGFCQLEEGFPYNYIALAVLAQDPDACEKHSRKPEDVKKSLFERFEQEIERIRKLTSQMEEIESTRTNFVAQAWLVPSPEVLDRLLRYEAHLDRLFDRILVQFEHLKRMRHS